MKKDYLVYVDVEGLLTEESQVKIGPGAELIESIYAEENYQDKKVNTQQERVNKLENGFQFKDELATRKHKLNRLEKLTTTIPGVLVGVIFLIIFAGFLLDPASVTTGELIGQIIILSILLSIIYYSFEWALKKLLAVPKSLHRKKIEEYETIFNEQTKDENDKLIAEKKRVLIENQPKSFDRWKSQNPNRYPYHLNFFHQEGFEGEFLKYTESIIEKRVASGNIEPRYAKFAQYATLLETDKIMVELEANDYNIVYVKRSTNKNIPVGMYFYATDDTSFKFFHPPYNLHVIINGFLYTDSEVQLIENGIEPEDSESRFLIFDEEAYQKTINDIKVIDHNKIIKFDLFGTELMQSTVFNTSSVNKSETQKPIETKNINIQDIKRPGLLGTVLSQLMFGTSYTVLKGASQMMSAVTSRLDSVGGKLDETNLRLEQLDASVLKVVDAINNISIQTTHEIIDTRSVQIVFEDKSDIELEGISIYYDLNRYLGSDDKKNSKDSSQKNNSKEQISNESITQEEASERIKKFKSMQEEGLIDEDEYKEMKKDVLKKIN